MPTLQLKYEHFTTGLILSLLLHLFFGASLLQQKTPKAEKIMIVEASLIEALNQIQKRQMVSPPDKVNKIEPKDAKFLSEEDSTSPIQQIKRGDGENAGKIIGKQTPKTPISQNTKQSTPQKQTQQKQAQQSKLEKQTQNKIEQKQKTPPAKAQTTNLPNTKLDLRTDYKLLNELSRNKKASNSQMTANTARSAPAEPFSRSAGSNAMFYGFSGSNDYLPNVQDGDITLLNAKADKFAVFVRRVAIRVFNLLKQYGWEYLRASEFVSLTQSTELKAILTPKGKLIKIIPFASSGNTNFDRIVQKSTEQGVEDPNPPPAALASDGNYHFIFKARSWSQIGAPSRNGPASERRWLVLQTGLE